MSTFVLAAGGTGGHLFPAMSLAQELRRRGHAIHLMTDHRVESYGREFPAEETHVIPSASPSVRNPLVIASATATLGWGTTVAMRRLKKIGAAAVVGFGGYPSFPPLLAGTVLGVPTILHEQNSVMGRANRALLGFADVLALTYAQTKFADRFRRERVLTGNPVRDSVRALAGTPFPSMASTEPLRLTIFAGSQGARAFAEIVPAALAMMPQDLRLRLRVSQQCRAEDLDRVTAAYRDARINCELRTFFDDLPERLVRSHLVIARAGASTIADLTALARPAILIPLPGSIDSDQKHNAMVVEAAGGGWLADQASLSPQLLASRIEALLRDPDTLAKAAAAAGALGQPDAVVKLADLAMSRAGRRKQTKQGTDK